MLASASTKIDGHWNWLERRDTHYKIQMQEKYFPMYCLFFFHCIALDFVWVLFFFYFLSQFLLVSNAVWTWTYHEYDRRNDNLMLRTRASFMSPSRSEQSNTPRKKRIEWQQNRSVQMESSLFLYCIKSHKNISYNYNDWQL